MKTLNQSVQTVQDSRTIVASFKVWWTGSGSPGFSVERTNPSSLSCGQDALHLPKQWLGHLHTRLRTVCGRRHCSTGHCLWGPEHPGGWQRLGSSSPGHLRGAPEAVRTRSRMVSAWFGFVSSKGLPNVYIYIHILGSPVYHEEHFVAYKHVQHLPILFCLFVKSFNLIIL